MNRHEDGNGGNLETQSAETILETIGYQIDRAFHGEIDEEDLNSSTSYESIRDNENFWNNYQYLEMLDEKVFQGFADSELYDEGKIEKSNVAVIDIDICGSTANLEKAIERFEQDGVNDASRKAVEEQGQALLSLQRDVMEVFRLCGIKGDKFMGDGARGLCEEGVMQAACAAHLLRDIITKKGLDVRIGIDVGDVTLVSAGTDTMRKAFMVGDTVKNAEQMQKDAEPGQIFLSKEAGDKMAGCFTDVKLSMVNENYVLDELAQEIVSDVMLKDRKLKISFEELEHKIRAKEVFLPASRVRELRYQFLGELEPKPSIHEVSTLVVDLFDIEKRSFDDANNMVAEVFEVILRSGGDVDKMDGTRIMANFISGRNDSDCVQAGVRIAEKLQELEVSFKMSAARSTAVSVVMGGDRTILGRVANMVYRQIVDAPENVLIVDEDLMEKVKPEVKTSKSIGKSDYRGIGNRERFEIQELKGWYELAKPKELLFREQETESLNRDFELVKQTGGRCMVIAGRPGFGKSALAAEYLDNKKREGFSTFFGRAEEYTHSQSFSVWRNLFDNVFGSDRSSIDGKIELLLEKNPDLQEILSLLNPILKTNFEESPLVKTLEDRPQDKEELRAEIVNKLLGLFANEASPAVILLEDMQYFDDDSKKLLSIMLKQIQNSHMQLLVTTRLKDREGTLDLPPEEFEAMTNVNKLELGGAIPKFSIERWKQNNGEDFWELANTYVNFDRKDFDEDRELFKRVFKEISAHTEGNILAFQLYLRHLIDKGYFESTHPDGNGKIVYSLVRDKHGNPLIIPDEELNLGDIVGNEGKRYNDLESPELKNVLSIMSVAGSSFTLEKILYVCPDYTEDDLKKLLQQAEERGFVRHISGDSYAFANNEIQPAIYQTLSEELSDVQYYHRLFAQYHRETTPDDLNTIGFHVRHSDDHLATLEIMDVIINKFKEPGAKLNAIKWASRALGYIKQNGWKAMSAWNDNKEPELRDVNVLETNEDELIHNEIKRLLVASGIMRRIRPKDAVPFTEKALSEFDEIHQEGKWSDEDYILRCKIISSHARNLDKSRNYKEADKLYKQLFDIVNRKFSILSEEESDGKVMTVKEMLFDVYYNYGLHVSMTGEHELAIDYLEDAMKFCINPTQEAQARNSIAVRQIRLGNYSQVKDEFQKLIELAESDEIVKRDAGMYLMNLGEVHASLGEFDMAMDYYEKALKAADEARYTTCKIMIWANQGYVWRAREQYDEAIKIFTKVEKMAKKRGDMYLIPMINSEIAFCHLELGNYSDAEDLINHLQNDSGNFKGRGFTLDAVIKLLKGKSDITSIGVRFKEGIDILESVNNYSTAAFDKYYFGKKLLDTEHGDMAKEYLKEAYIYYKEHHIPVLIPKIESLLGIVK